MIDKSRDTTARNTYILANVTDEEGVTTQSINQKSLKEGNQYTFREDIDLSASGTEEIVIANEFSEKEVSVVGISIRSDNTLSGFVDANVDGIDTGTDFPGRNDTINSSVSDVPPELIIEYGGNYSGGEAQLPIRNIGGGKGGTRLPIEQIPLQVNRIESGFNLRFQIEEASGNAQVVTVEIIVNF